MSSDHQLDRLLARAARRTASGAAPLLSGLIEAWKAAFPDTRPEDALDCSRPVLVGLALCRRPRSECFVADLAEISQGLDLDLDRLITFVRAGEAVERFTSAHPTDTSVDGRLLAARDRDEDET